MLQGKSVVLTGASSGLGAALALTFAQAGAKLALLATNKERLDETAARCTETGAQVFSMQGDVTCPQDCKGLIDAAAQRYGAVDYLVANAGVSMWVRFDEAEDLGMFRKLMDVNYMGTLNCVHYALPHLKQSKGMIVAISSVQGKIGVPLHTGYVAAKHALQGFCEALRMELKDSGVDILTVLPNWLQGTNMRQSAFGKGGQRVGMTSRKHSKNAITVEAASEAILKAMRKRQRQLVIPWKLRLLITLNLLAPRWAEAIIMSAVNKQGH
jgi:short-subunit dehydrogenase